jgi:hypothetical protein
VIAGFGRDEVFPVVRCYSFERIVEGCLKYKFVENRSARIGFGQQLAVVIPFAQSEMVSRFIEGVDPEHERFVHAYLSRLLIEDYPKTLAQTLKGKIADVEVENLKRKLIEVGKGLVSSFRQREGQFKANNFIDPIIEIVAVLPKDELAAMAESFVNLTSFKRKMSAEQETVGGPIDVAVISRGDGFVWIKRKHYFDPKLNPGFLANYYREGNVT